MDEKFNKIFEKLDLNAGGNSTFRDTVKAICNSAILDIPDADTLPLSFPYDEVTGISDIDWRREQKENKAIARVMEILEQREESRNESIMVRSGVDEMYGEREILMDEVIELAKDMKKKGKKLEDKTKVIKEEKMCKDLRKHALETLTPSKSGTILWKNAKKTMSLVSFLREKKQSRDKELKLRREQWSLERERFELEKIERLQKLEYEKQQSTMMFELFTKCLNK
ncbi:uncharacterized protein LOC144620354 [Crassostrea virginica]